jgi:hypothetical protein
MSGRLTFTPTVEHLLAAYRTNYKAPGYKRILIYFAFGLILGFGIVYVDKSWGKPQGWITIGVVLLWCMIVLLALTSFVKIIWMPRYSRRIFSQQRDLQQSVTISWDEDRFTAVADSGTAHVKWADFHKWRRAKDVFLLYRSDALFNFLPLDDAERRAAADICEQHLKCAGVKEFR